MIQQDKKVFWTFEIMYQNRGMLSIHFVVASRYRTLQYKVLKCLKIKNNFIFNFLKWVDE